MSRCFALAHKAEESGDVPVGALVVAGEGENARIIGQGWNCRESLTHPDPTAHAEVMALRQAAMQRGQWRLDGCTLVVTLEPCVMCAGAIVMARIDRVVFGAWDPKAGACGSTRDVVRDTRLNHEVEVFGGIREVEAAAQLRAYFVKRR